MAVRAAVSFALLLVALPATASAGTPLYPDLRMEPPADLHLDTTAVDGQTHNIVRFTTDTSNAGEGPLELHGYPHFPPDGLFDAKQWVYEEGGGFMEYGVGTFQFHQTHTHFHFNDFARYELWSRRAFNRAQATGFARGAPLYTAQKVSFCMEDSRQVDPASTSPGLYETCTPVMEGISTGWADTYEWLLPDQWIDVGTAALAEGKYVVRQIADPDNLIYESPGKADPSRESQVANQAYTYFSIVNGQLVVG
jgi:Lysyl oxidase